MYKIAALYKFASIDDPAHLQGNLKSLGLSLGLFGTILVAREGINGTVAGQSDSIDAFVSSINDIKNLGGLELKFASSAKQPFKRFKVKLKTEIVTMGVHDLDPSQDHGQYVEPKDWNALIMQNDVVVIDTRNDYEVGIGTFRNAIDPDIRNFRDFPRWWQENEAQFEGKKIAMFCTGGIRCEKSTSFVKSRGFAEVYHLKGGILQYLEDVDKSHSIWDGECFVFDERVAVGHGLEVGEHSLCFGCRRPLSPEDLKHDAFELGVACPKCHNETSDSDKDRFRERQRQNERRSQQTI